MEVETASRTIRFKLNGQACSIASNPVTRTSDVLREELGLTGTKVGCDAGDCGACTILIDGEQRFACLTAAGQLEGCDCLLYTSPSPRDQRGSRMPSSA